MDRDGVLNEERGEYTFNPADFRIPEEVPLALRRFRDKDYRLIVITNQAGISRGIYTLNQMEACHRLLQEETGHLIDAIYYSPYHPDITESLSRKPGTLLFERAIARFDIDVAGSWMIGDSERDMIPAKKLGIKTLFIGHPGQYSGADKYAENLQEAADAILNQGPSSR